LEMRHSAIRNPQSALIRVLVVDDSSFMRTSLTHILKLDKSVDIVGTAADGEDAIRQVKQLSPDVVLLDIEMPGMDGLAALAHIMAECPTPVLMLSGLSKRDAAIAIKSLDHGAVDFISKPSGVISFDIDKLSSELITKVKTAASARLHKIDLRLPDESYQRGRPKLETRKSIVIIGASTGGPAAVAEVLSALPRDISTAIIVIQHMGPQFVPSFVQRLQWGCSLNISIARKGQTISPGRALIAPGAYHTSIVQNGHTKKIRLSGQASPNRVCPSIDYAMESVATAYGEGALGVLLTGVGTDGARGMKAIKDAGGSTIAQDESSCVVFGMPKAAIEIGGVDEVVPLSRIAQTILRMI